MVISLALSSGSLRRPPGCREGRLGAPPFLGRSHNSHRCLKASPANSGGDRRPQEGEAAAVRALQPAHPNLSRDLWQASELRGSTQG